MSRFLLFAACASVSIAKTVTYNFDIGWVNRAPDGYLRPVIGINGQWPIPIIEANKGDTIIVNARNSLGNQSTSLHFHGMRQQGSNAYDGPVGVAQCPINPGDEFQYKFKADPPGTHWYHSHDKGQYPDGLRGKLIVHDPDWEKSLNIDEQIYLSVSDWYHEQQPYVIQKYLSPDNRVGDLPSPDSFLFNDTRHAPTFNFRPGKRYLLRIVSTSALACTEFHIDGHTLTVVGVDGTETQPQDADSILICAGQSYSVIVTGRQSSKRSFKWIAKMTTDMFTQDGPSEDLLSVIGDAVYSFSGKILDSIFGSLDPSWVPSAVLNDFTLKPLDNTPILKPVDQEIRLRTNQTYYEGIGTRIGLGYQPWVEPKVPSLYTALSTGGAALVATTYGPGVDPWVLKSDTIIQVYMENPQPWPHPMHLHGHEFQVVARGTGKWDRNEAALPPVPLMRNVVVIPPEGYLVLRFKADNPGVWFFHCHIDLHLVGGMASTFIEAPKKLQRLQSIPSEGTRICVKGGQCNAGNCACQPGRISAAVAESQCNTIFNYEGMNMGAMISDSDGS